MTWEDWLIYAAATIGIYSTVISVAWFWACYWPAHPVVWTIAITITTGTAILTGMYVHATVLAIAHVGNGLIRALRPAKHTSH